MLASRNEGVIRFLPDMAMVDLLQHWVYEHPEEAKDLSAVNGGSSG